MKLLNFGLYDSKEPQQSLREALCDISDEYFEYSWASNQRRADRDLQKLIEKNRPDVVFMQIQNPGVITAKTLNRYQNIKFFNFSGDVREEINPWYFDVAPYCTTLFTNTDWVEAMKAKGHRARYFQVGFDHNIYKPEGPKEAIKPVVFMGNNHGNKFPLSKLREEMVERFSDKEWFQVCGRGWKNSIDLNYQQQREAAVYRGAKIAINLSHLDLGSYTSDRMFRAMGCGPLCLSYAHKDIDNEFVSGHNIITWQTLDELEFKIEVVLSNKISSEIIAQRGCEYVHKYYTWPARMRADLIPLLYELA